MAKKQFFENSLYFLISLDINKIMKVIFGVIQRVMMEILGMIQKIMKEIFG